MHSLEQTEVPWASPLNESALERFVATASEAMVVHDSGVILQANRFALRLFACSAEEFHWTQMPEWLATESQSQLRSGSWTDPGTSTEVQARSAAGEGFGLRVRTLGNSMFRGRRASIAVLQPLAPQTP